MTILAFGLGYDSPDLADSAHTLILRYGFKLQQDGLPRLQLTSRGLVLLVATFSPLKVEFNALIRERRIDKSHGLIKACKPSSELTILDVTAGWGRDAGLLAQYGAHLIMVERQPIMAALLEDGLKRLSSPTLDLSLIHQDALEYLISLAPEQFPDVIYIDPMHPERQKSALVKKDMQALQQLFGPDGDVLAILNKTIQCAKKRVVVKWPQKQPPLGSPQSSIPGKTVRFDVYLP